MLGPPKVDPKKALEKILGVVIVATITACGPKGGSSGQAVQGSPAQQPAIIPNPSDPAQPPTLQPPAPVLPTCVYNTIMDNQEWFECKYANGDSCAITETTNVNPTYFIGCPNVTTAQAAQLISEALQ